MERKHIDIEVLKGYELLGKLRAYGGEKVSVGRAENCDIELNGHEISRHHASLVIEEQNVRVRDFSRNGITCKERRIFDGETLSIGQRIDIGQFTLVLGVSEENKEADEYHFRKRVLERLIEHIDLTNLDRETRDLRPSVEAALERLAFEEGVPGGTDIAKTISELADEALGLGPLEQLLALDDISEIMVVNPSAIFIERSGRIEQTQLRFTSEKAVRTVIERIIAPLGRRLDELSPMVDARLFDGSRVNAVIPPIAIRGACLTIRKFKRSPLQLEDLIRLETLSDEMAVVLCKAVTARANIIISGGTGSGKTTLLGVLANAIPETDRIVTIEDAAELRLPQEHVVSLETRPPNSEGKGIVTIRDLVKNALRMRPDRIVVGECRGGEALDMLQAMNTGHDGSLTTLHANTPAEAVSRLETLCLMSGMDLPARAIRQQIASAVHLIVQQTRMNDGSRRVTSIAEVSGMEEDHTVRLNDVFRFSAMDHRDATGKTIATGWIPAFLEGQSDDLLTGGPH